jgi:hypothetical protein
MRVQGETKAGSPSGREAGIQQVNKAPGWGRVLSVRF